MRLVFASLLLGLLLAAPDGRAQDAGQPPPRIRTLKKLYPQTVLVDNGVARAVIVAPDDPAHRKAAERLRDLIQGESGAAPAVKLADELVDADWQVRLDAVAGLNLIALGNVNNNRLLSVLYGEECVAADSIYPGEGGYEVRTVHDPFAVGINVLALAGSDAAGVERAVSVFAEKYLRGAGKTVTLREPVIDVVFAKKAHPFFPDETRSLASKRQPQYTGVDWFKEQWQAAGFMDKQGRIVRNPDEGLNLVALTEVLARAGQTYFRTGNKELLPLMKDLLDKNRHLLQKPAPLVEMSARSAEHVRQWDLLEELPIWTDADRLDVTNALLMDAAVGHERRPFHEQVRNGCRQTLDENHGTHSALRSFHAWRYFHKYYHSPESEYWMRCADAVFSAQSSTFQILEDASGYLCYCPAHTVKYAFERRDLTYLKRGIALEHARYVALACINNLGLATGFGDSAGVLYPEFFELFAPIAWYHRDPRLYWIIRNKLPQDCGLRIFQNCIAVDLTVEPKEPTEWTGLIRVPIYEAPLEKGQGVTEPVFAPKKEVDPKLFNKIVFKENWSPDGQYLLLDGAGAWSGPPGPHGHKHDDINTIINFTQWGRMWLVDHTYQRRSPMDHSGLSLLCDGQGAYPKRSLARLDNSAQDNRYAFTRSTFGNWERTIFWKKGHYFLVLDRATADKNGEFFARCAFKALGEAEIRGKDLHLTQSGRFCKILTDSQANVDIELAPFEDEQGWKTFYPHAEPIAKMFQEDKKRALKKGESITFANLLYAYPSKDKEDSIRLLPVSEECAMVLADGSAAVMGLGAIPGGSARAEVFLISENSMLVQGCATPVDASVTQKVLEAARAEAERRKAQTASASAASREVRGIEADVVRLDLPIHAIRCADTDGDGSEEWIVGGQAGVGKYTADGRRLWAFPTSGAVRRVDTGDLDGDGKPEILFGCDDEKVHALDTAGKERWSYTCKASHPSTSSKPAVDYVKAADLDGDGKVEAVAGANWVHVLSGDGRLRWEKYMDLRRGRICGDFVCGDVADINGDGKQEIVALFLTSYCLMQVFNCDGERIVPAEVEPNGHAGINIDVPVGVAAVDLFGGGRAKEILVCATAGGLSFFWHDQKRNEEGGGRVPGAFVRMCSYRGRPSDPALIVGADTTCGVVAVRPKPRGNDRRINTERLWYRALDEKVTALAAADLDADGQGEIFVGTKAGNVYVLDAAKGEVKGWARVPGAPVTAFAWSERTGRMLAARGDGTVLALGGAKK